MTRKCTARTTLVLLTVLTSLFLMVPLLQRAEADAPIVSSVSFSPTPPDVDSTLNITVRFTLQGEPIRAVSVQSCSGGICDIPSPMQDDGSGTIFFFEFPANKFGYKEVFVYFHFFIDYGTSSFVTIPSDPESHEFNVTMLKLPKVLYLTSDIDRTVVFPNQTVEVSGNVRNDLEENVSSAQVVLAVKGTLINNTNMTDQSGDFAVSVPLHKEGNWTVNLTITSGELHAYREWTVRVDMWPLPKLDLTAQVNYAGDELPQGMSENTFYVGTEVNISYHIVNSGSGDALNVTSVVLYRGTMTFSNRSLGTLEASEELDDLFDIDSSTPGTNSYTITAIYDQMAPEDLKLSVEEVTLNITFVPEPVWTGHRPLVEMFTQTTCVPCVYMEEALERLHRENPDLMDLIVYVYEDPSSLSVFQLNGITSTPEVIVDRTFDRIKGIPTGEDVESLMGLVNRSIGDASLKEVPPIVLTLAVDGDLINVTVRSNEGFSDNFSGKLEVHRIEPFSNMRNNQGLPIANRFLGKQISSNISNLGPGKTFWTTIPIPQPGTSYVALVLSADGSVAQSASLPIGDRPDIYVLESTVLRDLKVPGQTSVPVEIESFGHDESDFEMTQLTVRMVDLPANWSIGLMAAGPWTPSNLSFSFGPESTNMAILPVGRYRWNMTATIHILAGSIGPGEEGLREMELEVLSSGTSYKVTVLLDVRRGSVQDPKKANITEFYLKGEARSIYFYVRAENVPDDGLVGGRVLPCLYGNEAQCGVPKDLVLLHYTGDLWRAPVQGNDMFEFTHLTYYAWIDVNGTRVVETGHMTVKIEDLIEPPKDDDDDGDGPSALVVIAISLLALLFLIGLSVLLVGLVKRTNKDEGEGLYIEEQNKSEEAQNDGTDEAMTEAITGPGPEAEPPISSVKPPLAETQPNINEELPSPSIEKPPVPGTTDSGMAPPEPIVPVFAEGSVK